MRFQMEETDVLCGVRGDPEKCAGAFCIRRTLGRRAAGRRVEVGWRKAFVGRREFPLPPALAAFVAAFDAGKNPAPIAFELPVEGRNRKAVRS